MTQNKRTVERYLDGFRRTNHEQVLSCLTDDVEWEIPGAFHVRGKEAFDKHIEDEGFVGSPVITVTRMTRRTISWWRRVRFGRRGRTAAS